MLLVGLNEFKKYVFTTQEIKFSNFCLLCETSKSARYLFKKFKIKLPVDTPCLLIRPISVLFALENDSGLLLVLAILNDSGTMAE